MQFHMKMTLLGASYLSVALGVSLASAERSLLPPVRHRHVGEARLFVEGAAGYGVRRGQHIFWISPDGSVAMVPTGRVEVCPGSNQVETIANEADCEGGPSGAPDQGG